AAARPETPRRPGPRAERAMGRRRSSGRRTRRPAAPSRSRRPPPGSRSRAGSPSRPAARSRCGRWRCAAAARRRHPGPVSPRRAVSRAAPATRRGPARTGKGVAPPRPTRPSLEAMAHPQAEPVPRQRPNRPAVEVAGLVGVGAMVAVLVAAGLTALSGTRVAAELGLPDPGTLTVIGLPVMRVVSEICMVLTIGAVLVPAFLVAPQSSGYLDVAGYRALRAASWTAAGWTVAAALMVPLSMADVLGRPVGQLLDPL